MVDRGEDFVVGRERAVGLHFELVSGAALAEELDEREPIGLVNEWFAAGENHTLAGKFLDGSGDFGNRSIDDDVAFLKFLIIGAGVVFVRVRRALKIPRVIGIAPMAEQIAAAGADKNCGYARADALALEREKDFGAVAEFCQLHGWEHGVAG